MILKFSKPKVTWSAFFKSVTFNSKKISDIIKLIVIFIIATKNTQFSNINAQYKNKNKKKKNN